MAGTHASTPWYFLHPTTRSVVGTVDTDGSLTLTGPLVAAGAFTPTAGVAAAGGFSASPRNIHTGGRSPFASTDGTDTTPSVTETYYVELFVPCNMTLTGFALFNGSAVAGNVTVGLFTSAGVAIAAAKSASTAQSGTDAFQRIPFATPYAAVGPATYYVGVQFNNTSARFNSHPFGNFAANKKTGETYGTFTALTVAGTFTADLGPMGSLY